MTDRFQTTRWSLVLQAAQGVEGSRDALQWLCATYWYPLYAFVRRQGPDAETARDLTQSFFVHLLDKDSLRRIDPQQGRFRAFLLASVKNFLANERKHVRAFKRRADDPDFLTTLEVAEERYRAEPSTDLGPDELFETKWALAVLDRAVRRLGDEMEGAGKGTLYQQLRGHLTGGEGSYDELAAGTDMTAGALRVAVYRMRRRLGALLREEVAQTVSEDEDVEQEIRRLLQAVGRRSG